MTNVTTPETSARLKAAGFPQPVPEFGQAWYDDLNRPVSVRVVLPEYVAFSVSNSLENMSADNEFVNNYCCFAPTATDIISQIGIWFNSLTYYGQSQWRVHLNEGLLILKHFTHTNPAEAAALAWMSIHEKKEQ